MKNDLITTATTSGYFDKRAFALAAEPLTANEIAARRSSLSRRISAVRKTFRFLRYLVFAAVCIAFCVFVHRSFPASMQQESVPVRWVFVAIAAFALATFSMAPLAGIQAIIHHFFANTHDSYLLQPMAGTIQCEYSLKDLENGGERVAQWRDLAVNERGQLHGFDGCVMSALRDVYLTQKVRDERQAEVDQACRKLHGLEPLAPAVNSALEPVDAR